MASRSEQLLHTTIFSLINFTFSRIIGHMLAGGKSRTTDLIMDIFEELNNLGKVAENANIASAVTPKWRSAKTHVSPVAINF